jgi:hypothetical protein
MNPAKDPLEITVVEQVADDFTRLTEKPATVSSPPDAAINASTAVFHGFALDDRPLLTNVHGRNRSATPSASTRSPAAA